MSARVVIASTSLLSARTLRVQGRSRDLRELGDVRGYVAVTRIFSCLSLEEQIQLCYDACALVSVPVSTFILKGPFLAEVDSDRIIEGSFQREYEASG